MSIAYGGDVPAENVPACSERLQSDKLEKKMKKVLKEGGKKGVEIEGAADMGGLKYFCTKVLEPKGDLEMLIETMKAMNQKCDPEEEERKGGSGAVGKSIWSMDDDNNLCIVTYSANSKECNAKEWLQGVLESMEIASKGVSPDEKSNENYAFVKVVNDGEKEVFCLKVRDYVIQKSNEWLIKKELIPEIESESEEECYDFDDYA